MPRWDNAPQAHSRGSNFNFDIWIWGGNPMHIPWKITEGRQSSLPLGVYVEGIARAFNWLKCLGGIIHLKPTAGCQISTLNWGKGIFPVCPDVDSMWWMWNYRNISIIGRWKSFEVHFALIYFYLVLRHIALMVARNWSLAWTWSIQELQVHFHAQRGYGIGNYCFIYGESISNQRIEAWFYWWRKPGYQKKATDHSQATDNFFFNSCPISIFF